MEEGREGFARGDGRMTVGPPTLALDEPGSPFYVLEPLAPTCPLLHPDAPL